MIHSTSSLRLRFIKNRTIFITLVVWNVMLSFYNKSETLVSTKPSYNTALTSEQRTALKDVCGVSSETIRAMAKEAKQERKDAQSLCRYCGKLEIQLNTHFKSCGKCLTAGGSIKYCSR